MRKLIPHFILIATVFTWIPSVDAQPTTLEKAFDLLFRDSRENLVSPDMKLYEVMAVVKLNWDHNPHFTSDMKKTVVEAIETNSGQGAELLLSRGYRPTVLRYMRNLAESSALLDISTLMGTSTGQRSAGLPRAMQG
jgi:hypothetical protein